MLQPKQLKFLRRNVGDRPLPEIAAELKVPLWRLRIAAWREGLLPFQQIHWLFQTRSLVIILLAAAALQGLCGMWNKANVWDEPAHLMRGYLYATKTELRQGEHPPLSTALAALPLRLLDLKPLTDIPEYHKNRQAKLGYAFLYENSVRAETILRVARLSGVLLAVLAAFVVFHFASALFGPRAGLLALLLAAFSPTLLAHARWVTTDFPVACFMLMFSFAYFKAAKRMSFRWAAAAGVAMGAALTTKISALVLVPASFVMMCTAVVLSPAVAAMPWRKRLGRVLLQYLLIAVCAYGTIWTVYGFRYSAARPGTPAAPLKWLEAPPTWHPKDLPYRVVRLCRDHKLFPEHWLLTVNTVVWHTDRGHTTSLMGETRRRGWWYYFPLAMLLKTPVATLILLGFTVAFTGRLGRKRAFEWCFLLAVPATFMAVAMCQSLNIGIRHILPVYPFLFVACGSLVLLPQLEDRRWQIGLAVLGLLYVVGVLRLFPDYMAYFNVLAGGPNHGRTFLVDSNLDWGQDLKGLKRYMTRHHIPSVKLSYFGTASPDYYHIHYEALPSYVIFKPSRVAKGLEPGYYAVSATNLEGAYLRRVESFVTFLKAVQQVAKPVARIGHTIYLYNLSGADYGKVLRLLPKPKPPAGGKTDSSPAG